MAGKATVVRSLQFHFMLKIPVSVWTGQNCNVITALGKGADSLHKHLYLPSDLRPVCSQGMAAGAGPEPHGGTGVLPACETVPSMQQEYISNHPSRNCAFPSQSNTLSEQSGVRRRCLWRGVPTRLPVPAGWPRLHGILTFGDILFRWEQFDSCLLCNIRPRK